VRLARWRLADHSRVRSRHRITWRTRLRVGRRRDQTACGRWDLAWPQQHLRRTSITSPDGAKDYLPGMPAAVVGRSAGVPCSAGLAVAKKPAPHVSGMEMLAGLHRWWSRRELLATATGLQVGPRTGGGCTGMQHVSAGWVFLRHNAFRARRQVGNSAGRRSGRQAG
jgi:hypothetical protein